MGPLLPDDGDGVDGSVRNVAPAEVPATSIPCNKALVPSGGPGSQTFRSGSRSWFCLFKKVRFDWQEMNGFHWDDFTLVIGVRIGHL